jgi:hypothetical protein
MAHRSTTTDAAASAAHRGNRRTRGGAGRHNRSGLRSARTAVRTCLSCNRPFRSRGPGNRICSQCREENAEIEPVHIYHLPGALRGVFFSDADEA